VQTNVCRMNGCHNQMSKLKDDYVFRTNKQTFRHIRPRGSSSPLVKQHQCNISATRSRHHSIPHAPVIYPQCIQNIASNIYLGTYAQISPDTSFRSMRGPHSKTELNICLVNGQSLQTVPKMGKLPLTCLSTHPRLLLLLSL